MWQGDQLARSDYRIGIASPLDIWSAGLEAVIRQAGWAFAGHWPNCDAAQADGGFAGVQLLIVSRHLIADSGPVTRGRPLAARYSGKLVVIIHPEDRFTTGDFVALDVEGLLLASASLDQVSECIAGVSRGGMWIDPGIRALLGAGQAPEQTFHQLSAREQQVARLAATGLSNKRIARKLEVSDGTVKMHMHHILAKLQLTSRFDLVRSAAALADGLAIADRRVAELTVVPEKSQAQIIPLRQY